MESKENKSLTNNNLERSINADTRQIDISKKDNWPETLRNPIYTPAFLREQIGKLMRVEFLIGTNNLVDRIGILEDVGASYILLRSFENDSLVYCDIYAIKFITISTTGSYANYLNYLNSQKRSIPSYNMYNIPIL